MLALQTDYRATEASLPAPADGTENIRSALQRALPEFQPALFPHDGTIVVCGSGPSLPSFLEDIRAERVKRRPIIAVKGAHDLLCAHGIEPDAWVSCEAKPRLENVQRKNDHTAYFVASRCSPELFDWLDGKKVVRWHSYSDKGQQAMPELAGRDLVGGGTTSGLRAVTLAYLLGFSKFVLYGFDSCLSLDKRKRYDSGQMKPEQTVTRILRGRRFLCNGAMAMQADEFQEYYKLFPDITFDVKGEGLIAAIVAERRRLEKRA
jgi:uncharacterized Rossmann fold enzyme